MPRRGALGAFLVCALAVGACGDDGSGTDSGATDPTAASDPSTSSPQTTSEESTAAEATDPGSSSGGEEPTTTGAAEVSYTADIQPLWEMRCTVGCHSPGGSGEIQTGLDLSAGVSYAQLVGVVSIGAPALSRVAPGDVQASYLWHKLKNTQADVNGSGFQMPAGGLPDADVAMVESWIAAGAQP